jgi:hypothetical protein
MHWLTAACQLYHNGTTPTTVCYMQVVSVAELCSRCLVDLDAFATSRSNHAASMPALCCSHTLLICIVQVATVMFKLWRYTTAYQGLLPVQQQLQRHRSSMAALRPIFTALQDSTRGQQLHAKLQQQLQLQPQQQQHQQQQQRSWAQLLAQPSNALVQQLLNQLPGVPRKGVLQLLRLLSEAVAGLEVNITADMLQQMVHALDHPGSFESVTQQPDDSKHQLQQQQEEEQEPNHGITTMQSVTVKQEQQEQQQESQVDVTAAVNAAVAEQVKQEQQDVHDMQVDYAEPIQAAVNPHHTALDTQLHIGLSSHEGVRQQQQQQSQQKQQRKEAPAQAAAVRTIDAARQAASSQDAEDEPYSPTRHAADEPATTAPAAAAPAAAAPAAAAAGLAPAVAGVGTESGSTSSLPRQEQQQQHKKQLVGAKRIAMDEEQLQQPHSMKTATAQAAAAATSSKSVATATAAKPSATDGRAPAAAAAAGSADAMADAAVAAKPAVEAAAAAAATGSKPKLPGEAYALTLFDDLRFSLQQLGSAKAVVDTHGGRLVQLAWYLQVDEALRQRLTSEELALKFITKFSGEEIHTLNFSPLH